MKKFLLSVATACFLILGADNGALAQNSLKANVTTIAPPASTNTAPLVSGESITTINSRAVKDFRKAFKSCTDEKWFKLEDGFIAKFTQSDIPHRVDYDRKGNWIATTRYYSEKELPKEVRKQVKSVYYDYSITSVQELRFHEHLVYLINIEDDSNILTIRICDGEMDVFKELKKSEGPKN